MGGGAVAQVGAWDLCSQDSLESYCQVFQLF